MQVQEKRVPLGKEIEIKGIIPLSEKNRMKRNVKLLNTSSNHCDDLALPVLH